jgi:recombination protein RecT
MTQQPAPKAGTIQAYFQQHKSQIELALPKHLNADRMCRLALTALSQNKTLAECDPRSIFASVVISSQMGLEIGVAGQGYLVPYKGKAQFVPGWQGLVDLVSRSGRATAWTGAVFQGDEFDWALGDRPYVRHRPAGENDPAKLTHVYAIGRVNGSDWPIIEVWTIEKVRKHRDKFNKVGTRHYSFENWEMYARKIPLLQVIKYLPKSIELANALALDAAHEQGRGATIDGNVVVMGDDDGSTESPPPTFAELEEALSTAETQEGRDLIMDSARHLPDDQLADLTATYKKLMRSA